MTANPIFHGPECRCGSRRTVRTGELKRRCFDCGQEYFYRVSNGILLPFSKATADGIDERRAEASPHE